MMGSLMHSLNYMLPQGLHFTNDNIQQILQNSHNRSINPINATTQSSSEQSLSSLSSSSWTSTSTVPTLVAHQTQMVNASAIHGFTNSIANEFLRKLGATLLNSIQLQNYQQQKQQDNHQYKEKIGMNLTKIATAVASTATSLLNINHTQQLLQHQQQQQQYQQQQQQQELHQQQHLDNSPESILSSSLSTSSSSSLSSSLSSSSIDMDFMNINHHLYNHQQNHVAIDAQNYSAMDELQKQLEYDKFMNEVWIGVVLTLIFISMIFCFCSCFLYHQFIMWKRNYRSTLVQSQSLCDIDETVKMNNEFNDPVPEYTLVSGLPSYEAALELLRKTKQTCLGMQPSIFNIFEFEKFNNNNENGNDDDNDNDNDKNDNTDDPNSYLGSTNLEAITIDKNYCSNNNSDNYISESNNDLNNDVERPLLTEQIQIANGHNDASNGLSNFTTLTHINEQYYNQM